MYYITSNSRIDDDMLTWRFKRQTIPALYMYTTEDKDVAAYYKLMGYEVNLIKWRIVSHKLLDDPELEPLEPTVFSTKIGVYRYNTGDYDTAMRCKMQEGVSVRRFSVKHTKQYGTIND